VTQALAPPFLVASLVLCVAGAFKLRSPEIAAAALRALRLPGGTWLVRGLAVGELVLGAACAVNPSRATAAALAAAYLTFAGVAAALVGRRVACGCFGEADTPVSRVHVAANLALGAVAVAAAVASPRGLGWLAGQPAGRGVAVAIGIAGAAYAVVLAYTEVPRAWGAWGGE
jgi:hypothetical protein